MKASVIASGALLVGFLGVLSLIEAPTDTVNPVIGDESFVATFGRAPTDGDPNLLRVRTHLAYVEGLLRSIDDPSMPAALRAARRRNLDLLRSYWQAERFPAGENPTRRQPTFIDDAGVRCAVAYLVEASAGTAAIEKINGRFRNAVIGDMDDAGLDGWIATSGFTRREVMMIQPSYRDRSSWPYDAPRWDLVGEASVPFLNGVGGTDVAETQHMAAVDAKLQLIDLHTQLLLGGEGAVGRTSTGATFYRLGARTGGIAISNPTLMLTAGYAIDGIEGLVPRASTLPVGLLFSFDTTNSEKRYAANSWHEMVPWPLIQLRAEAAWILKGRSQTLDWTAGLDLVWRVNEWTYLTHAHFALRDIIASVTVTEFAGTIYGGFAIGVGFSGLGTHRVVGYQSTVGQPYAPYW